MDSIDKIIDSLDGLEQAQPSAHFTQKVMAKWEGKNKTIPARTVWSVAAAIALLVAVNIWVGVGYKSSTTAQSTGNPMQNVVNAYGLQSQPFSY